MAERKKIRILHIAQAAGGVDRYIRMLLKYLDRDRFENILVCSYDFKKEKYNNMVVAFEQLDLKRSISSADVKAVFYVRKLIKKYKPDIVYAHSSKAGVIARVADIGIQNVCIYNPHGWSFNMRCSVKEQVFYKTIEKLAAYLCKKIICISEAEKDSALAKKICPEIKMEVILNGIDIKEYENNISKSITRNSLNISSDAFVVGMVGRICTQKAPDIFIETAKYIKKDIPKAFFIIVGNGEQENFVMKYAEENGLADSLLITGWVDNPICYIELFDVAMLLSRWEGFGLVLPEYMLAKKPIVASRVDAIPSIVTDRKNAILVEVDNVEAVHNAVIELYENKDLRNKLIVQGFIDVHNRFDARRVAIEHEELFVKIIKR